MENLKLNSGSKLDLQILLCINSYVAINHFETVLGDNIINISLILQSILKKMSKETTNYKLGE